MSARLWIGRPQTTVTPTPCAPIPQVPSNARVTVVTLETAETAQVRAIYLKQIYLSLSKCSGDALWSSRPAIL